MPRNVSGTYSLPLPPVVANTVIQSAWANTTTDDIAQGITDSLDRNGRGGMIAPFRLVDGSVLQPAFAFSSESSAVAKLRRRFWKRRNSSYSSGAMK